jgi:hypothetical protein
MDPVFGTFELNVHQNNVGARPLGFRERALRAAGAARDRMPQIERETVPPAPATGPRPRQPEPASHPDGWSSHPPMPLGRLEESPQVPSGNEQCGIMVPFDIERILTTLWSGLRWFCCGSGSRKEANAFEKARPWGANATLSTEPPTRPDGRRRPPTIGTRDAGPAPGAWVGSLAPRAVQAIRLIPRAGESEISRRVRLAYLAWPLTLFGCASTAPSQPLSRGLRLWCFPQLTEVPVFGSKVRARAILPVGRVAVSASQASRNGFDNSEYPLGEQAHAKPVMPADAAVAFGAIANSW